MEGEEARGANYLLLQGAADRRREQRDRLISLLLSFLLSNHRVGVGRGHVYEGKTAAEKD